MVVRREETQRTLSGRNQENPLEFSSAFRLGPSAPLSVGGAANARQVQTPDLGTMDQVFQGLAEIGSKTIREAAKVRYNKQVMEGAMEYQQGASAEDLGGFEKRWQLEGYRQMDAATSAAALLSAQKTEIDQGLYEANPEKYREIYANRLELAIKGKDERTADLITEQMMQQMPTLVAEHTSAHMNYLERQAVSSLETSIDVMSRGDASIPQMIAFAKGEAGSDGLSTEARRGAVINGIARAYDNNNPAAFAILEQQGVLGEMSSEELGTIRAAQERWESRARSEYDEEFFGQQQAILENIKRGEYRDPTAAIDAMSELFESRSLTIRASEAEALYTSADASNEVHHGATVLELETAKSQGNYTKMADLTGPYIVDIESSGNRNAVSPTGAKSEWQVMDRTNADPGFGVRPAQNDSLEERARVGRDYWRAMVHRYKGDLEAAAVAYNAGPKNADNWLAAGRSFDDAEFTSEPARNQAREYVNKFNRRVGGERYAARASNRYEAAQLQSERVKEALAIDLHARTAPILEQLDVDRKEGRLTDEAWREDKAEVRAENGMQQSIASVNQDIEVNRAAVNAEIERNKKAGDDAYAENLELFRTGDVELQSMLGLEMERILGMGDTDDEGRPLSPSQKIRLQTEAIVAAKEEYQSARNAIGDNLGIDMTDLGLPETTKKIIETVDRTLNEALDDADELSDITVATQRGTLDTLPQSAKDRAWNEFQQGVTKQFSNMPPPELAAMESGMPVDQIVAERAEAFDNAFSDWYAKTGYVPDEVREQASAALTAQLINEKGEPSQYAVEAAQDYIKLKGKSQHAADNYLNPEAQVVAEAILSITGGRASTIPQTIQRLALAAGGPMSGSTGQERRDPKFLERTEVQKAITTNVSRSKTRGFFASILGGRGAGVATVTGAGPDAEAAITRAIEQRVAAIHAVNPNIPPQHVVDLATDSIQQQMAVVDGELLLDPTGRDIYNDVFGPQANSYRNDPNAIGETLHKYVNSREFMEQMASQGQSLLPDPGMLDRVLGRMTSGMLAGETPRSGPVAIARGNLDYNVEAVGNGNLLLNFTIDPDEGPITIPIQLRDVGVWFNNQERARRTR